MDVQGLLAGHRLDLHGSTYVAADHMVKALVLALNEMGDAAQLLDQYRPQQAAAAAGSPDHPPNSPMPDVQPFPEHPSADADGSPPSSPPQNLHTDPANPAEQQSPPQLLPFPDPTTACAGASLVRRHITLMQSLALV